MGPRKGLPTLEYTPLLSLLPAKKARYRAANTNLNGLQFLIPLRVLLHRQWLVHDV
jgi:hypothetical protein